MSRRRLIFAGHLDRYVWSTYLASLATAFLMILGMFLIVDMAERMGDLMRTVDGVRPSLWTVGRYYVIRLPFIYLEVAPFVTLIAALFTVSKLMRHNEVTAMLAAGISAQRVLRPILVAAVLLAMGMFFLRENVVEHWGAERIRLEEWLRDRREEHSLNEVFLRDRTAGVPVRAGVFHAGIPGESKPRLENLEVVLRVGQRWINIEAPLAEFEPAADSGRGSEESGQWRLTRGIREDVDRLEDPPENVEILEGLSFTPWDVEVAHKGVERPLELSFSEVQALIDRDPDNAQLRTLQACLLAFPAANVVLLLVGLPFLLRQSRSRGAEGVAAGFLLCVFYFGADFVTRTLGMQGALSPLLAAWLPIVGFGSLGLVLWGSARS
jgi:lipopolysaccharide export system permease protein